MFKKKTKARSEENRVAELTPADILKMIRRIEVRTLRIVNEQFAGQYHSAFRGRGIEFDEVRNYVAGDDVRSMDWKVSARYGEPFVKRFKEERELSIMLLVDFSASNNFGVSKFKRNLIVELSALLAFSAIKNGDKVGLIIFTDKVERYIAPRKGRNHILQIIRELIGYKPQNKTTNISAALIYLNKIQRRKSVSFLLTDFCSELPSKEIKLTKIRHDFVVCLIQDTLEYRLPKISGCVVLEDLELGQSVYVDLSKDRVRESYFNEQTNIQNEQIKFLNSLSVESLIFDTHEDYIPNIIKFFSSRKRRHRH